MKRKIETILFCLFILSAAAGGCGGGGGDEAGGVGTPRAETISSSARRVLSS